jgi:hypothetical protein
LRSVDRTLGPSRFLRISAGIQEIGYWLGSSASREILKAVFLVFK